MLGINEVKTNAKLYTLGFCTLSFGFTLWQKTALKTWFFPFSLSIGMLCGSSYAIIKTGWFVVEKIDALGKDYEISRLVKQDIFDSRPDLNSAMRA